MWLRGKNGHLKKDLSLPYGNDDSEELAEQIRQDFNAGKDLVVTVMKVKPSILQLMLLQCAKARAVMQAVQ